MRIKRSGHLPWSEGRPYVFGRCKECLKFITGGHKLAETTSKGLLVCGFFQRRTWVIQYILTRRLSLNS